MEREAFLQNDEALTSLFKQIKELTSKLGVLYKQKYNRSLPFAELMFDRWERASELGFGEGTSIYDSSVILGDVIVGKHTWIGPNTLLDGSGKLTVGNNCSISANVQLYSHDSVQWAVSGGKSQYEYDATQIGDNCYIGPNTVVAKGVVLGNGCIVGANSFVNKCFQANSKIGGNPAKLL